MTGNLLLCETCYHWFDPMMAGDKCPICWVSGREDVKLPTETEDPNEWVLDEFGHAIERKETQ